jgi:hypothetical protein
MLRLKGSSADDQLLMNFAMACSYTLERYQLYVSLIKSLLHKRNKLMRKSNLDKAIALGEKIGKLISEH